MRYLWVSLALLISGCTQNHAPSEVTRFEVTEIAEEAQIPKAIMNEVEADIQKEASAVAPTFLFMPLQVGFSEISDSVLKSSPLRYSFPKGGGLLDLKEVVTGFGSYYMNFPAEQFEKLPELAHLYYVSNSPVKKIGDESFGLGCGRMLDLKKSFTKLQKEDFLKLNTSDLRYLFVTAGRYVFVFRQGAQVYITQLTVTDSRHAKELCMGADFL